MSEGQTSIPLKDRWLRSGIEPGDTILIHSNIKRTLIELRRSGVAVTVEEILQSFLDALGTQGTLLLPLFSFDFASGIPFDIRTSPSRMGALTEAGRLHKDAVRTGHPIYSFAVIGHHSEAFANLDNESGYAEDSPFGVLRTLNGKIGVLDLEDQNSMTFYHHVEEVMQVDYRYYKTFTADYTDWEGVTTPRSYKLYVRDIEHGVKTNVNPAGELMWEQGLYKGFRPKCDTGMRVIRSREMFSFTANLIKEGKALGTLYSL